MKQRLLRTAAIVTVVLALIAAGAWLHSYWVVSGVWLDRFSVSKYQGGFYAVLAPTPERRSGYAFMAAEGRSTKSFDFPDVQFAGFEFGARPQSSAAAWFVRVPIWFVALFLGGLSAWLFRRSKRNGSAAPESPAPETASERI